MLIFFLLLGCGHIIMAQESQKPALTDTALSAKVCGIWLIEGEALNGNAHQSVRMTLATNGEYMIVRKTKMTGGPSKGAESTRTSMGTWSVKDGCLVMTKLKTRSADGDIQQLSKPEISTIKIARVNDKEMVYSGEATGQEMTWNRSK